MDAITLYVYEVSQSTVATLEEIHKHPDPRLLAAIQQEVRAGRIGHSFEIEKVLVDIRPVVFVSTARSICCTPGGCSDYRSLRRTARIQRDRCVRHTASLIRIYHFWLRLAEWLSRKALQRSFGRRSISDSTMACSKGAGEVANVVLRFHQTLEQLILLWDQIIVAIETMWARNGPTDLATQHQAVVAYQRGDEKAWQSLSDHVRSGAFGKSLSSTAIAMHSAPPSLFLPSIRESRDDFRVLRLLMAITQAKP